MSIKDLEALEADVIQATDIADILGVNAQSIREQAKADKNQLGFEVIRVGTKLLIPRVAFIRFMKGEKL